MLAAAVQDLDLCILNSGEVTHYHTPTNSGSVLDLSFCSSDAFLDFSWRVIEDLCGSDHYPLVLTSPEAISSPRIPRWRVDRANWNSFRSFSRVECSIEELEGVEEAVAYFTNLIQWSAEQSVPQTSGARNRRPVPWWSEECWQAVVERRRAFGRFRPHKTDFT